MSGSIGWGIQDTPSPIPSELFAEKFREQGSCRDWPGSCSEQAGENLLALCPFNCVIGVFGMTQLFEFSRWRYLYLNFAEEVFRRLRWLERPGPKSIWGAAQLGHAADMQGSIKTFLPNTGTSEAKFMGTLNTSMKGRSFDNSPFMRVSWVSSCPYGHLNLHESKSQWPWTGLLGRCIWIHLHLIYFNIIFHEPCCPPPDFAIWHIQMAFF